MKLTPNQQKAYQFWNSLSMNEQDALARRLRPGNEFCTGLSVSRNPFDVEIVYARFACEFTID